MRALSSLRSATVRLGFNVLVAGSHGSETPIFKRNKTIKTMKRLDTSEAI
jgi:hypothetical protein